MTTLDWFRVPGAEQFIVGVPLRIEGVGSGYQKALDHARDALAFPHRSVSMDMLTAECNELADSMLAIAREDGDSLSLGGAFRAMLLEAARSTT